MIKSPLKILLAALGFLSLGLGILGAFLPVLPTTPLLLLAAMLFLKSDERLHAWLMNHPRLGTYISNFVEHKAIPMRVKVISIAALWITLGCCAVFVTEHLAPRLLFLAIAVGVTTHILSYRTLR